MTSAQASDALFWTALGLYTVCTGLYFVSLRRERLARLATRVAWAALLVHAGMIATRTVAVRRVPWGNMYEYSTVLVFLLVAGYLVVIERKPGLRVAAPLTLGLATVTMVLARGLYVPPGPLMPALNSWWLKVHVISAILASSIFTIGFVFSVLYLLKDRSERRGGSARFAGSTVGAAWAGPADGFPNDHVEIDDIPARAGDVDPRGFVARLPASRTLDAWAYKLTAVAFPIWTWAVIAGAIWGSKAWGRYWGWDPKETWAFITWVVYAGYLHARATAGWRGRRAAAVNAVGFVSLWINYYLVNLVISGLHSYAGV